MMLGIAAAWFVMSLCMLLVTLTAQREAHQQARALAGQVDHVLRQAHQQYEAVFPSPSPNAAVAIHNAFTSPAIVSAFSAACAIGAMLLIYRKKEPGQGTSAPEGRVG